MHNNNALVQFHGSTQISPDSLLWPSDQDSVKQLSTLPHKGEQITATIPLYQIQLRYSVKIFQWETF